MNSLFKTKKGELTLGTIVGIILLIIGFAIIIYFLLLINYGDEVGRETCHQSVIFRGTLPTIADSKDYVPLKCKTAKYCISTNKKGECEEFKNSKDAQVIKVKDKEEIERFIARDLLQCWTTMGEGKVSIFSNYLNTNFGIGSTSPSCVICSRIAFDKNNLENSGINLETINVRDYMLTHTAPGKDISYAKYMAGENGKISVGSLGDFDIQELKEDNGELIYSEEANPIKIEEAEPIIEETEKIPEIAIMFMQISAPVGSEVFKNTIAIGGIGLGTSFFVKPKLVSKAVFSQAGLAAGVLAGIGLIAQQANVAGDRAVTAGYCDIVSVGNEAREGCSVVVSTDYDATAIAQYCERVESIV